MKDHLFPQDYTFQELVSLFSQRYGKTEYHASAFFRHFYSYGNTDVTGNTVFSENQKLARLIDSDFHTFLPEIIEEKQEEGVRKLALRLADSAVIETVILSMQGYNTICISSQVGCRWGCAFCRTAKMGFVRNLSSGEIISQVLVAVFVLKMRVRNIVFMGMGEPLDNIDAVLKAVEVVSDQRGLNIPKKRITVSTVGFLPGLKALKNRILAEPDKGFDSLRIAVSLNAADEETRNRLMPVNRKYSMEELHSVLNNYPIHNKQKGFFIEYVLISGVNNSFEDALALTEYLKDLNACVNIIPLNPGAEQSLRKPNNEEVANFFYWLTEIGQSARVRNTKGRSICAACGQLVRTGQ